MAATLLYKEIYNSLRGRIFSGELKPGDLLPSENSLCALFNVSRETVRKALKALENEGLIYSRMKVGYFVSVPNHSDFTLRFTEGEGFTTRYISVRGVRPPDYVGKILECDSRGIVIELCQLTTDSRNTPLAYDIKYIPYERATPLVESEMRFTLAPVRDPEAVATFGYYTTIEVSAAPAPQKVASALGCETGSPLLLVERTFVSQDGRSIGYSMQYSRKSFGRLYGVSGPQK